MDKISVYEYSGIICPGALFLWLFDSIFHYDGHIVSTLGGFGFFLIIAFCVGNLIQGFANILEDLIWKPGKFTEKLLKNEGIDEKCRIIYGLIRKKGGNTDRVDIFNKQYGLMRGMFVCFLFIIALIVLDYPYHSDYRLLILLILFCFVSSYRAFHFAKLYTNELISEYKIAT